MRTSIRGGWCPSDGRRTLAAGRLVPAVALAMGWLLGCGSLPEDLFHFTGRLTADEQPVVGRNVSLSRGLLNQDTWDCVAKRELDVATSDDEGRFSFEVFRIQLEPFGFMPPEPGCALVTTEGSDGKSWIDLFQYGQTTSLGTLALWSPATAVADDRGADGGLELGFDAPPTPREGRNGQVRVSFLASEGVF
jgi:hypothetical protein